MKRWIGWSMMVALVLAMGLCAAGCRQESTDNTKPVKDKPSPTKTAAPTPTAAATPTPTTAVTATSPVATGGPVWVFKKEGEEGKGKWVRVPPADPIVTKKNEWASVFDGKTMKDWKQTPFEDTGKVTVGDGEMLITKGEGNMTGATWTGGALPTNNYEIELEAKRVDGPDFFCGLTFPVRNDCISLIVGGWGGTMVGLSCLDYYDAANNETGITREFEQNKWYMIRVRITDSLVGVWIEYESVVEGKLTRTDPEGKQVPRHISVRSEVEKSQPFGLATYQTTAAIRSIRVRLLTDEEVAAQEKVAADKIGP
jgi:hypothetical protein